MFKRIIIIGQCGNDAVYLDSMTNRFYKKPKHRFMDMKRGRNVGIYTVLLVGASRTIFPDIGSSLSRYDPALGFSDGLPAWFSYVYALAFITALSWGLSTYCSRVAYGDLSLLQPAGYEDVREAVDSNLFLTSAGLFNDRVTVWKYALSGVAFFALFVGTLGLLISFVMSFLRGFLEGVGLLPLRGPVWFWMSAGVVPFAIILLVWLNNPIRFLNVARRFRRGGYVFGDE